MDCPYYHGNIDGVTAESLLLSQPNKDGAFLIRDSGSTKGAYILCLLYEKKVYQYRILSDKNKKLYIESTKSQAVSQTSSLNELVELYLSKGNLNGLKTSLVRGVRREGMDMSDSDTEDDENYVDTKYIFSSEKDQPDFIMSTAHQSRVKSSHIYAEPADDVGPSVREPDVGQFRRYYSEKFTAADKSKVSSDFTRKVQSYIDRDLVIDASEMSKDESKLSSNHIPKLKSLIVEETVSLQRQLTELLYKVDLLRDVIARPAVDVKPKHVAARIDSESPFNTVVGLLSQAKQEMCTLEMEAVNSYNELAGYANVDPLAVKRGKDSFTEIPVTTFKVVSAVKALLSGPSTLSLTVDVKKGFLHIIKESSQSVDSSTKYPSEKILQIIKSTTNSRLLEVLIDGRKKEAFYFENIKEREHFCQLVHKLKKVHSKEMAIDSISIFCGTWNMGNELAPQLGLQPWLKSQGLGKTRVDALTSEPHDIYAIGTQEAKVSEKDWVDRMTRLLHNQFGVIFHPVDVCTLWQIRLVVFVKREHKHRVSMVQQAVVRTGIANALGNKGAAAISLNFDGTSLCFLCSHLAANRERLARRNQNSRDIMKALSSSIGNRHYADFDITNQFNHVFFLGDLNYRVDGEIKDVLNMAAEEQYPEMLKLDQLLNTINEGTAFYGYNEEVITFPPTYRYKKLDPKNTFNWKKIKKSGVKINAPSWCDRVLWKSLPNCAITNTSYGVVPDLITSDHKPVFSSFTVGVLPQNIRQNVNSITSPIGVKMYDISCEVLIEHSSEKHSDYCLIVMGSCLEAAHERTTTGSQVSPEGNERVKWSCSLDLKPSFSDASYLQTQHVLIAVKTHPDGMVIGDTAVSLLEIFQSREECIFECDLTYLGGKTGSIRGAMKAIMEDTTDTPSPLAKRLSNSVVVVDDTYAAPLSGLSWDDYGESPTSLRVPDSQPRVRGRPMSFVSSSRAQRVLPPLPNEYDVPPTGLKAIKSSANVPTRPYSSMESSTYYNAPKQKDGEYYNTNILQSPSNGAHSKPPPLVNIKGASFNDPESDDYYESAEPVKGKEMEPIVPPRSEAPVKPRRALPLATTETAQRIKSSAAAVQGSSAVTSWLLAISMPQYVNLFKQNNWTKLNQISKLSRDQLVSAGVRQQHVFRLEDALRKL